MKVLHPYNVYGDPGSAFHSSNNQLDANELKASKTRRGAKDQEVFLISKRTWNVVVYLVSTSRVSITFDQSLKLYARK